MSDDDKELIAYKAGWRDAKKVISEWAERHKPSDKYPSDYFQGRLDVFNELLDELKEEK